MKIAIKNTGFTLAELLVASTIGTFLVLVAVGALRAVSTSARIVTDTIDSAAEVRFASNLIARDLTNLYRDPNFINMKFLGTVEETSQGPISILTFYTVARTKARPDQAEGDVYEVEYYLIKDQEQSNLFRRLWPYPDPNEEAEPSGVLTAIAENIELFEVRYFDGSEWSNEWPEEMQTAPQLVEVNIVAQQPGRPSPTIESITVNLVRSVGTAATTLDSTGQQGGTGQQGSTGQETGSSQSGSTGQTGR